MTGSAAEGCELRLVTDQGVVLTAAADAADAVPAPVEWHTTPARSAYVRAEVRHPAGAPPLPGAPAALTNPVFLDGRPDRPGR